MLSFAEALLENKDSFRAATEFMRVIHFFPDDTDITAKALSGLGRSYASAGRWEDASGAYGALFNLEPTAENRHIYGTALYFASIYPPAVSILTGGETIPEANRTLATLAWIKSGEKAKTPAKLDAAIVAEHGRIPRKSPALAGVLSAVLPGSGHLYAERPRDAFMAFVVNSIFIWGTVSSANRGNEEAALALGAIELIWYSGTISGAVTGAQKWNHREEERFFERHESGNIPSFSFWGDAKGGGFLLSSSF
jgi:hypothetical protein